MDLALVLEMIVMRRFLRDETLPYVKRLGIAVDIKIEDEYSHHQNSAHQVQEQDSDGPSILSKIPYDSEIQRAFTFSHYSNANRNPDPQ